MLLSARPGLQVKVAYPVDQVEQTKGGGEEDTGVRVDLGDADV